MVIEALNDSFEKGRSGIFNTDLGSQFMSREYTTKFTEDYVEVSMDGCRRATYNLFIERLCETVKYEEIYQKA